MTNFDEILAQCLESIENGEPIEACLERYPQHAQELEPLLRLAATLQRTEPPRLSPTAFARGRELVVQAAATQQANRHERGRTPIIPFFRRRREPGAPRPHRAFQWTSQAAAIAAAVILTVASAVWTSSTSLPGAPLYGVKRVTENVQGLLYLSPEAKANWHASLAARRLQEAVELQRQGRPVPPELLEEAKREFREALAVSVTLPPEQRQVLLRQWLAEYGQLKGETPTDHPAFKVLDETTEELYMLLQAPVTPPPTHVPGPSHSPTPSAPALPVTAPDITTTPPPPTLVSTNTPGLPTSTPAPPTSTSVPVRTPHPPTNTPVLVTPTPVLPTNTPAPPVQVEVEFKGVVEAIWGNSWRIAGHQVIVTAQTRIEGQPNVGDVVEVHALQQDNGTLLALRIKVEDEHEGEDGDKEPPKPTKTPKPDDDDGTPQPTKTPKPDDDDGTPQPTKTPKPDDDDGTPQPTKTPKPDDDDGTPQPTKTPKPDDDDDHDGSDGEDDDDHDDSDGEEDDDDDRDSDGDEDHDDHSGSSDSNRDGLEEE